MFLSFCFTENTSRTSIIQKDKASLKSFLLAAHKTVYLNSRILEF